MTRLIRTVALALFIAGVATQYSALSAEVKLGTVDSKTIVDAMKEFKQIEAQVGELQKRFSDTLVALKNRFDAAFQDYQTAAATMDADAQRQAQAQLQQMQNDFQQYQTTRFGDQGMLALFQAQLQVPVREKVIAAIKAVATSLGLNVVMEEGSLLYVDSSMDITFKVLEYIKKQG